MWNQEAESLHPFHHSLACTIDVIATEAVEAYELGWN